MSEFPGRSQPPSLAIQSRLGVCEVTVMRGYALVVYSFLLKLRDFIQAKVETKVKQKEEESKRAIPGVCFIRFTEQVRPAARYRRGVCL
jgi:hypothetical protein